MQRQATAGQKVILEYALTSQAFPSNTQRIQDKFPSQGLFALWRNGGVGCYALAHIQVAAI